MRRFVFLLLGASFCGMADAQISIVEYRDIVIESSLEVMNAQVGVEKSLSEMKLARKDHYPSLTADGEFNTGFRRDGDADLWHFAVEPRIEQTIYAGGGIRAASRQAEIGYFSALEERRNMELEMRYQADYAYWSVSAMELYMGATAEYVKIIRSLYGVVKERFSEGLVSKSDMLQVEARLSEAEYSQIAMQKNYEIAVHRFNNLQGVADTAKVVLVNSIIDTLPIPKRESAEDIIPRRPDVEMAQAAIRSAEQSVVVARAAYLPRLSVGVRGSWQTYSPNNSGETYLDGAFVVGVNVPIFQFGKRRHAVASARADLRREINILDDLHDVVSYEEADGWSALESSFSQMQSSLHNLEIAGENLSISTYSYNEGQATVLDVLQAQISWIQIYTNAITARFNYAVAWSNYNKITAREM